MRIEGPGGRIRRLKGEPHVLAMEQLGGLGFRYVLTADGWTGCLTLIPGRDPEAFGLRRRRATHASVLGGAVYVLFEGDDTVSRWICSGLSRPIEEEPFSEVQIIALDGARYGGRCLLSVAGADQSRTERQYWIKIIDAAKRGHVHEWEVRVRPVVLSLDREPSSRGEDLRVRFVDSDGRLEECRLESGSYE